MGKRRRIAANSEPHLNYADYSSQFCIRDPLQIIPVTSTTLHFGRKLQTVISKILAISTVHQRITPRSLSFQLIIDTKQTFFFVNNALCNNEGFLPICHPQSSFFHMMI
ncbi:hypothetical protein ABKN59_006083 [Abortiporus biennis]